MVYKNTKHFSLKLRIYIPKYRLLLKKINNNNRKYRKQAEEALQSAALDNKEKKLTVNFRGKC